MIRLPDASGELVAYTPRGEPDPAVRAPSGGRPASRAVLAAAHVVPAASEPYGIDWEATLSLRRHLLDCGLGVAEAMDTAQRGAGLSWAAAAELTKRSAAQARALGGRLVAGAGTDQLTVAEAESGGLGLVRGAYEEQLEAVEETGAQAVLMASRALAATAAGEEEYLEVYGHLLRQASEPVILHWLGPMFDPALEGYWGSTDLDAAAEVFLEVIEDHPDKVDGVKVSLLDAGREVALRRRLPDGVRCYTGDDFHYPELIAGDRRGFSHALLGVFGPLAPLAADAVRTLDTGDTAGFRARLDPTVPLARHLFAAPTRHYKAGVALLAHLAGHQARFALLDGAERHRDAPHLARAYRLADELGLFPDPERAESRMRDVLAERGVGA
ncbi:DUF993 family protein [Streptomyces xiaopingdaonensis]|uniref:DUF993 family protein n=1 Tax=Streptomyces xiaopingdaonensis TaxID=1565415 RepID=UPI00031BE3F8|nr:DUF993 family protein [Streptomyces xiaopingdaonensis]